MTLTPTTPTVWWLAHCKSDFTLSEIFDNEGDARAMCRDDAGYECIAVSALPVTKGMAFEYYQRGYGLRQRVVDYLNSNTSKKALRDAFIEWEGASGTTFLPSPAALQNAGGEQPAPKVEACPDCRRAKAISAADAANGLCPKWWAIRDEDAERDCTRAALTAPVAENGINPCPFCRCTDVSNKDDGHEEWFECDWCHATSGYDPAFEAEPAAFHWNRRATPSPTAPALEPDWKRGVLVKDIPENEKPYHGVMRPRTAPAPVVDEAMVERAADAEQVIGPDRIVGWTLREALLRAPVKPNRVSEYVRNALIAALQNAGGEQPAPVTCTCYDEASKRLCLKKSRCFVIEAHNATPAPNGVSGAVREELVRKTIKEVLGDFDCARIGWDTVGKLAAALSQEPSPSARGES